MWKLLLNLLFISSAYAQVFTEDIAKINHFIAEEETAKFMLNPTPEGLPGEYFNSLALTQSIDPLTGCEDDPEKTKPLNLRYEVIAITEEIPAKSDLQPQTTIIVAKFEEPENELVTKLKGFIENRIPKDGSDQLNGRFEIKQKEEAAKHIVLYSAPGTSIDINSQVQAEGTYALDVADLKDRPISSSNAQIQMDVTNRVSLSQQISRGTSLKGSLESLHSTGQHSLDALNGVKFNLSTVRAQARVDSQINRSVQGYSQVNYTANTYDKEVRTIAGLDIRAPGNAQIMVFTGFTNRHSSLQRDIASRERELGIEYKPKKGVSVYGRMKDGNNGTGRSFETGIKIDLNR